MKKIQNKVIKKQRINTPLKFLIGNFSFSFNKHQQERQQNIVSVHMHNGKYPTVLIAQDAEKNPSLESNNMERVEEKLLLCTMEKNTSEMEPWWNELYTIHNDHS